MIKKKRGISLIVLSITILVMAILAATAIISLEDSGIIGRSKDTVKNNNYSEEYTRLQVIKNGILTDNLGTITVDEYITELTNKGLIESEIITNADGSKTVTTKTGLDVIVSQNGPNDLKIIIVGYNQSDSNVGDGGSASTITLNKTMISKTINSGSTATETITATTANISGALTWASNNTSIVTVAGNGNTATITMKSGGTAVVTAKYGSTSASCTVVVTENVITGDTPLVANRPFTISDYSCTVEWASNIAEHTILCDAMDKDYNPVYVLKAGMTKSEYDALGLKFRRGSWIFIAYGTLISNYDKYYYSTGEILDTYARAITVNKCPMFQVNGDGTIAVNVESTLNSPNSSYTTENPSIYSTATSVDVFRELNSSDIIYNAENMVMFDGAALTSQAGSYVLPYILKLEVWSQIANRNFIPGSLIYCDYDMPGRLVKVHSEDGYNVYVVAE
ncbi:MAG: hypothetical protein IKL68_03155 [Clostridia bacterium]|nr:hypothetical protein [Clostridia bacterium]